MNKLKRLYYILFLFLTLNTYCKTHSDSTKAHQLLFKLNNTVSLKCDSLLFTSQKLQWITANRLYLESEEFDVSQFSVTDSFAYYFCTGYYLLHSDEYESGMERSYQAKAICIRENLQVKLAAIDNQLGLGFSFAKDHPSAIMHYNLVKKNDSAALGSRGAAAHNIAASYLSRMVKKGNVPINDSINNIIASNYRDAMYYFTKKGSKRGLAATYSTIMVWLAKNKEFDSAFYYGNKAFDLCAEMNDSNRLAFTNINIGKILVWNGQSSLAIDTLIQSSQFYKKANNSDQYIHALRILAMAYDSLGMHKKSAETYSTMFTYQQKAFPDRLSKSMAKYKAKYQTYETLFENEKLKYENRQKSFLATRLWLAFGITSLSSILIFFILRNRVKKRDLAIQRQELKFKNRLFKSNMESEENERKRIARELHDGVGQQLSSIKLGLENIDQHQTKTESTIAALKETVSAVLQSVRSISHQMMPIALQRFGLVKAIESLVDFLNNQGSIAYSFESYNLDKVDLNESIEVHLYRIVQELSTNINKHSDATEATIQLYTQGKTLFMTVSDNGKGFNEDSNTLGMGLMNVHTRVTSIGGELNVNSKPGETYIVIKTPL